MKFTSEAYHEASLEHVDAARELLEQRRFALANYVAGVSVECVLRAYSLRHSSVFDHRHDLRAWYDAAKFDNVVTESRTASVAAARGIIFTHWSNSQRYCSNRLLGAYFKLADLDRGIRGDFVKELTRQTVDAAYEIVIVGDVRWKSSSRK